MSNAKFAITWFAILTAAVVFAANRFSQNAVSIKSDMLSLLGQDSLFDEKIGQNAQTQSNKFILLLAAKDKSRVKSAAKALSAALGNLSALQSAEQAPGEQAVVNDLLALYREYPFTLLDDSYQNALKNNQPDILQQRFLAGLTGTGNPFINRTFEFDPTLALAYGLQDQLNGQTRWQHDGQGLYQQFEGLFYYPIFAEIADGPLGVNQSVALVKTVEGLIAEHTRGQQIEVFRSGLLFHVGSATEVAQKEIGLFSSLSTFIILLAALLVFRSIMPIIAIVVIMSVAMTFGGAGLIASVDEIHLLTFIFAISLIGISVDYAFHTLSAAAFNDTSKINLSRYLAPAMLMGAATTVLGYLSMLLMPLKALHQITVFMIFGLIAALATALWWLAPLYHAKRSIKFSDSVLKLTRQVTDFCSQIRCIRHIFMVAALLFATFGINDFSIRFDDNVANLNSSAPALVGQERKVQQLMGYSGYPRYIVFNGATDQQVLHNMQLVESRLGDEVKSLSLAKWIPTEKAQMQSKAELKNYLDSGQVAIYDDYLEPQQLLALKRRLDNVLLPQHWPEQLQFLAQGLWQQDGQSYGIISYYSDLSQARQLQIQNGLQGVAFIDQPKRLTESLYSARTSLSTFFLLATLAFTIVLVGRYGLSQGLFSLLTPLFAALGSLVISQFFQEALSIFNLLSCLLIAALAIDYIVFFNEHGHKPHVVLAIFLSALSSIAAFGMMALSTTPAVQHFGLSTLIGILLAVLMSFITPLRRKEHP